MDNYGNIYITLGYSDTIFIDNSVYIANNLIPNYRATITLKFDFNGNLLNQFSLDGSCNKGVNNVQVDDNQNMYIYGGFGNDNWGTTSSCTCVFDSTTTYSTTEYERFLAKYDSIGNLLWVNVFGNSKYIAGYDFEIVEDAFYITGGSFYASVSINFGGYTLNYPNNYDAGGFISKYDTSGIFKWAKYFGVKGWDSHIIISDIHAITNNDIIVGGYVFAQSESSHLYLQNSSTLNGLSNAGNDNNYFVICYDSLGNVKWKDFSECSGWDFLIDMTSDNYGNLYTTGYYSYSMIFGNYTLPSANEDIFINAYDINGNKLWAKAAGGSSSDFGFSIESTSDSNIYISGHTSSYPVNFDTSSYSISPQSSAKMFLAKLKPSIVSSTTNIQAANPNKKLIKIVDVLGRETKVSRGNLLFYLYSDGTVEKKVFVE